MKKLLPILVVSILVLGGLGAVAIPNRGQIENKPLNTGDWALEITVKGGLLGYTVNVSNVGNESVTGNLSMAITTDTWITIIGNKLYCVLENPPIVDNYSFKMSPLIAFGPAKINISVNFTEIATGNPIEGWDLTKGFVLLFYVLCDEIVIPIEPTP